MKLTPSKLGKALAEALEKAENPKAVIQNFLAFLSRKKAMKLLQKIIAAFENEWAKRKGILKMAIRAPKKFEKETETFIQEFEKKSGKKVDASIIADDSLIGGITVRMDDTMIDASAKNQLNQLAHKLKSSV